MRGKNTVHFNRDAIGCYYSEKKRIILSEVTEYLQLGWSITGPKITEQSVPDWLKMTKPRTSTPNSGGLSRFWTIKIGDKDNDFYMLILIISQNLPIRSLNRMNLNFVVEIDTGFGMLRCGSAFIKTSLESQNSILVV